MTAAEVIEEIKRLPRAEQIEVVEFARQVGESRVLRPEKLGELAKRMAEAEHPAEADRLQEEIVRGFYCGEPHARRVELRPCGSATEPEIAPPGYFQTDYSPEEIAELNTLASRICIRHASLTRDFYAIDLLSVERCPI